MPRFNEFRRQYGLRPLTSFDDFVDRRLPAGAPERTEQERLVADPARGVRTAPVRRLEAHHGCPANDDGTPINDCLGHPDGSQVDNVEDVDTVVGWLAEFTRPHGFAISETQLQVFILNASRRLFSDRFFTSSFRPEFYGHLGVRWVTDNGPDGRVMEQGTPGGRAAEVSPLKRVLLRTIPELGAGAGPRRQRLRSVGAGAGCLLLARPGSLAPGPRPTRPSGRRRSLQLGGYSCRSLS